MADAKVAAAPSGSEDAEVFLSASEDETVPQVVTPELLSALVKQVEFYFSDANLPTDKKLLKQIRKDPEGFVPVKLFANFRKVRALSKDVSIITEALRNATLLQLSQDGKRVRRIVAVPEYDISDIQRRTVVVENLPGNPSPTIESVTDMFRVYGRVKLVRICSRESKGKLPSWLTSSCQHMGGQQHAYVEFEEEDGAIVASAALAQDCDAPDGVVQVRRLLACIAEQRERRSVTGTGSSFGGSSGGGSRKGSRDVSPMGNMNANSRRGSGGGAPYGGSNSVYSCGGSTWTSSSAGGAAPDHVYLASFHPYRSYGGAYDHGGGSRTGSGGGAGPSPPLPFVPPPPPPPPRRSCDSAPPSELLTAIAPAPAAAPPTSGRTLNVYRPPAKRLSDGYHCGFQPSPVGGCPAGIPAFGAAVPPSLQRCMGASFGSSCGTAGTAPVSNASTPTAAPSSPSPMSTTFVNIVANSPPLSTRGASCGGGGRPPVHPPIALPPPPPPPKTQQQQQQLNALDASAVVVSAVPLPLLHQHTVPPATVQPPSSALAEAIAQVQAERRASEAGAPKMAAPAAASDAAIPPAAASMAAAPAVTAAVVAPTVTPRTVPTAPKFCLDLGPQARGSARSSSLDVLANSASQDAAAVKPAVQAALPRGTKTQMVANVEDFINNILAGRPATRPASGGGVAPTSGAQQRKPVATATAGVPAAAAAAAVNAALGAAVTTRNPAPLSSQQPAVDAAVAVAGILASTLRRPLTAAASTAKPAIATPDYEDQLATVAATNAQEQQQVATVVTEAPVASTAVAPMVYLTAVTPGQDIEMDIALEHAVTVMVTRTPAPGSAAVGAHGDWCKKSPTPTAAPEVTAIAYIGSISTAVSSPPSSPLLLKAGAAKAGGAKAVVAHTQQSGGAKAAGSQLGAKRLSRREYAQWAAATPEFRAEAASRYAGSSASGSPSSTPGTFGARSSSGGAGPAVISCTTSPPPLAALSLSDGGVFGTAVASGPSSGGSAAQYHSSAPAPVATPIWHVAKGPDGSKGFSGRARLIAA